MPSQPWQLYHSDTKHKSRTTNETASDKSNLLKTEAGQAESLAPTEGSEL